MNDTSQSHKITDFALKTLNAKNPTIDNPDNDTVISAHDVIHLIGHAGYTGDLNEKQPSINTS